MRFRYKAKQHLDMPLSSWVTHYQVTIQIYDTHKSKWVNFKKKDLADIIYKILSRDENFICDQWSNNYLKECLYYINKYNGLDNVMMKYIKEVFKETKLHNQELDEETKIIMELNSMLLSKDWKVIEVEPEE